MAVPGWNEVEIGGVSQWISVRGPAVRAPALLYLHGGPGGSEFGPRRRFLRALEDRWRVVEWEQRGAGRSFTGDEDGTHLTIERLVLDGVEVVEWARRELAVDRLVLVGHSFGSVLGVHVARRVPASISAYVGAGQVVDWAAQEEHGYEWAMAEAKRRHEVGAIAALERIGRPKDGVYAAGVRAVEAERRWLARLGGVSGDPAFVRRWVLSLFTCRDYPLRAKARYLAALRRSMGLLWPALGRSIDFMRSAIQLDVGVHLFAGRADHITPIERIAAWHAALEAPSKRLEVVEGIGHLNLFEAPARFLEFLEPLHGG